MKPKRDTKFGKESTCRFKIGMRNLTNFDPSTRKSQKFTLSLVLRKVYIVWAKKSQRTYLPWNWRGIKNLERNRLVFYKFTRIWQTLTWALKSLKNFHFNGLLLSKVYTVWAKKSTQELSFTKLKRDTKFGEESTCRFKIDIRNLTNFDPSTRKSQKFSL